MKSRHLVSLVASLILLLALGSAVLAQAEVEDEPPHVQVSEQGVVDGRVNIVRAIAPGPAWVVIHADADGRPGPVIGHAALEEGENLDVVVEVDVDAVTPLLHAMIHVDEGEVGTYEFPGADMPLTIEDDIVMAMFSAAPPAEPTPTPAAEEEGEAAASTEAPGAEAAAEATPAAEEEAEAETTAAQEATPEPEEEAEPTPAAEEEAEAAEPTPAAEEEAEAAEPTPVAEEEAETEEAAEPTPAAEEEEAAEPTPAAEEEAEATPAAEEEAAEPTPAAEEEAAPAPDAEAKGAAPSDLPSTGAGTSLPLILGAIAAVVSALGGSVIVTRRRRS